jgi:hypothetical protein
MQQHNSVAQQIEARVPEGVRGDLARRGHAVTVVPACVLLYVCLTVVFELDNRYLLSGRYCSVMGFGSAVVRDSQRRVNFGCSDPRVDGSAHEELACSFE